jgi:hypothetical protein
MLLGLFIVFFSWGLGAQKTGTLPFEAGPGAPPPSMFNETVLLCLGILVIICGLAQFKKQIRFAQHQVILGLLVALISGLLIIHETILDLGGDSAIYYVAIVMLASGLVIFALVLAQLRSAGISNTRSNT